MNPPTHVAVLEKRLSGLMAQASQKYQLIEPGDRVMVAVSGGKDSLALLHLLERLRERAPFEFSVIAVHVDQGHPGFPREILPQYFRQLGLSFEIVEEDTYSIVREKIPDNKTFCSLCSRLRRGILYTTAQRLGATKLALGHHADDAIETLLLNLFFSGQIKAMPPRLRSDDGQHVVIRPLILCSEADLAQLARLREFPIVPCTLCGSQENLQRQRVKQLISEWTASNHHVRGNLLAALSNVRPSHLMDPKLAALVSEAGAEPASAEPASDLVPARRLLRTLS